MEKVRTIRLYGKLGTKFGRVHRFVVGSPADAIKALCRMVKGFDRELMTSRDRGISYAVFAAKRNVTEKQLEYPSGGDDIRIAPVASGSKTAGLWQTIGGVALAAVGAVSMYFGNPYGGQMIAMGAAMALGGIAQMISAHATTSNGATNANYAFSGAQNVTTQGGPVPLLYGTMQVGSTEVSSVIISMDT
jgi:predicted phage tail protein